MTRRTRANLLLLLTAAIWGFAFVGQRVGAEVVGPFTFNAVRFALGSLSLLPLVWVLDRRRPPAPRETSRAILPGLLAGAALFLGATLQQIGMAYTTAGKASFITGLYIVIVPILGIALKHRTSWLTWVAVALSLTGLYLLSVTEDLTIGTGDALQVVGALFWACHILIVDRVSPRHDPLRLSIVQFVAVSALSFVMAFATEPQPLAGVGEAAIPILYGGLISVGIAYTLQVVAQRDAKPSHAALIMSMESVFGAVGGALILGEDMGLRGYLGCALMLGGILVSQARTPAPEEERSWPAPEPIVFLGPDSPDPGGDLDAPSRRAAPTT